MTDRFAPLRAEVPAHHLAIIDRVWEDRHRYLCWPKRNLLFMPGAVRAPYHRYSDAEKHRLRGAGIAADARSNGPAIVTYLLAGGERPKRATGRGWHIHHIYDGKFPAPGASATAHAVKHGDLFTEAAGLVAAHPIADALADEFACFAWLLRAEAYERFGLDPDGVFSCDTSPAAGER